VNYLDGVELAARWITGTSPVMTVWKGLGVLRDHSVVIAGFIPAIHGSACVIYRDRVGLAAGWITGTSPVMTVWEGLGVLLDHSVVIGG
jgi:hypothetical protein